MNSAVLRFLFGVSLAAVATVPVRADILPRGAMEARERFARHKQVFDRTDQYCHGKAIGTACEIPGTAFEGGGKGSCQRDLPDRASEIDLRCALKFPAEIDRQVPDGPFRKDLRRCDGSPENPGEDEGFTCADPAPVADRFCAGQKENDPCSARFLVAGKEQSESGRCGMRTEEHRYYQYGYRTATRRVLQCLPVHPAPEPVFTRVPLTRKLAQ